MGLEIEMIVIRTRSILGPSSTRTHTTKLNKLDHERKCVPKFDLWLERIIQAFSQVRFGYSRPTLVPWVLRFGTRYVFPLLLKFKWNRGTGQCSIIIRCWDLGVLVRITSQEPFFNHWITLPFHQQRCRTHKATIAVSTTDPEYIIFNESRQTSEQTRTSLAGKNVYGANWIVIYGLFAPLPLSGLTTNLFPWSHTVLYIHEAGGNGFLWATYHRDGEGKCKKSTWELHKVETWGPHGNQNWVRQGHHLQNWCNGHPSAQLGEAMMNLMPVYSQNAPAVWRVSLVEEEKETSRMTMMMIIIMG